MSDSHCNCCCQYSTPPWWVTMGFVPPANANYANGAVHAPGTVVVAPPATGGAGGAKPGAGVRPGVFTPGTAAGTVLGNTGSAIGNAAGTILETPLNLAGGILNDVVGGVGGLLGRIF